LPGAMEPYQAQSDYSTALAEVQTSEGGRSGSKGTVKDAQDGMKLPPVQTTDSSLPEVAVAKDLKSSPAVAGGEIVKREGTPSDAGSFGRDGSDKGPDSAGVNADGEEDSGSDEYEESDASDAWPPCPPVLRFKMRMQFSSRFRPTNEEKALFEEMNKDLEEKFDESHTKTVDDKIVGWLNQVFAMNIETEYQYESGYPVIMLTMLDAIYPKRVIWREVDWRFQYKRAVQKNFATVERIWAEVNMDKAREFRMENTPLRLENMPTGSNQDRIDFMCLMKKWYDQRIHQAGPYDPLAKRLEFVAACKTWGHTVKFPPWIFFDKDHVAEISEMDAREKKKTTEYNKMPEYRRLIWFLGCQEYQTM